MSIITNSFDSRACWAKSIRFLLSAGFVTLSAFSKTASKLPNCRIIAAAVFCPTLGTPGMLSELSPIRARKSTISSGSTPNFARTASWSISSNSSPFLFGLSILINGETSWVKSLSPVTKIASIPSCAALQARVPMTSSASTPSRSITGSRIASMI